MPVCTRPCVRAESTAVQKREATLPWRGAALLGSRHTNHQCPVNRRARGSRRTGGQVGSRARTRWLGTRVAAATATLTAEGRVQRSQSCPRSRAHSHDRGKGGAAGEAGVLKHGTGRSCGHLSLGSCFFEFFSQSSEEGRAVLPELTLQHPRPRVHHCCAHGSGSVSVS